MKLIDVIEAYVSRQQSLGMRFDAGQRLLRQFARKMGAVRIEEVQPQKVLNFLQGSSLSATWLLKYRVLSGFYRFAISRGHAKASPLPAVLPVMPPPQTPYVYSTDELRRLINATSLLQVGHSRL